MNRDRWEMIDSIFYPSSVAVVGAVDEPDRVGFSQFESVLMGGFKGRIYPLHPRLETILGYKVYRSLSEIPEKVDLAVIGVNQFASLNVIEECGKLGIKGAVCIAGGYREFGTDGKALEEQLISLARKYGVGIVGPNTLGIINTDAGLNTTFYPMRLDQGKASFVCQSGGIGLTIINKAMDEGLGINKYVAVGNRSVLDIADYLEYFAEDEGTSVIGLFIEGTEDAARLARLAGEVCRKKPVVLHKVGRSDTANYAAVTHTGSMVGSYQMYKDIFGQFGVLVVDNTLEMVAACKALAIAPPAQGNRVGIVTHTAGPSIALMDQICNRGCDMPSLSENTVEWIRGEYGKSLTVVIKNPMDLGGLGMQQVPFGRICKAVANDSNMDIIVSIFCLHRYWRFPSPEVVAAMRQSGKPLVALYISTQEGYRQERDYLHANGIPVYNTPEEAAWGVAALAHFSKRNS